MEEAKNYFNKAALTLLDAGNNNIKWHQAIDHLLMGDSIKNEIKTESSQKIYIMEYRDLGYKIIDKLEEHDDFKFFYGIDNYENKDKDTLFEEAYPVKLNSGCSRICPEKLTSLMNFLCVVNKIYHSLEDKEPPGKIFKENYFKKEISGHKDLTNPLSPPAVRSPLKYIHTFNGQRQNRREEK